jgi:hypothetical protein
LVRSTFPHPAFNAGDQGVAFNASDIGIARRRRLLCHIAIQEALNAKVVEWRQKVNDEQSNAFFKRPEELIKGTARCFT